MALRTEPPESATDILRTGTELLRQRLPTGWDAVTGSASSRDSGYDATLTITAANEEVRYLVASKNGLLRRDVPAIVQRLRAVTNGGDLGAQPLVDRAANSRLLGATAAL